jgi:NAD(P)-dependent dehydrogenase (short-subunit alcohol dehydrogenase family)
MMVNSLFNLHGKVALVTGAGGGFGRAFALGLASTGATVACIDRDMEAVEETSHMIQNAGGAAAGYFADVADESSLKKAIDTAVESFQGIDVLINNAGISTNPVRIHELSTQDWDRLMNINLRGTYLCSKMVLPHMLREKNGSIINISSIAGLLGFYPDLSGVSAAYSASKAGMMGFTRQLAAEYATDNIRCNAIAPGFHGGTDLGRERRAAASAETTRMFSEAVVSRTPLQRLGSPEELVGLVIYLASDASRFVTGQVIAHDGGWTAT